MSCNFQTTKYIERLVRIITQKEKLIDQLRKSSKIYTNTTNHIVDEQTSIVDQRVREELAINNLQIRSLQSKILEMEQKLLKFSQELEEESQINQQLRLSIETYEKRQKEMSQRIAAMRGLNQKLERNIEQLERQRVQELTKRASLELDVQQLTKKLQNYERMNEYEVKQSEKQLENIYDKVKNLHKIVNETPCTQTKQLDHVIQCQSKDTIKIIELIEEKLKKQYDQLRQNDFNETLDGISMIVRSLEYSLIEPKKLKNCSYAPTTIIKNQASVSQTAKQFKFQNLNKSKLQSTRLNCTQKILQDILTE